MNTEPPEKPVPMSAFAKLLATGLAGWVLGNLVLFGAAWPVGHAETPAIAAMWAISHWWIAFAFGAVLLIARGLLSRVSFGTALMAYLLPAALLSAIAGICVAVYPDQGFSSDLLGYMPLALIFYVFGFLWMSFVKSGSGNTAFLRSVIPATVGGVSILGLIAVPVFKSNNFIYRNAFGLEVSKTAITNGAMVADAVLKIHKSGHYDFTAPRFIYSEQITDTESAIELGKITWGPAGAPKEGAPGTYPFQIRWEKNIPPTMAEMRQHMPDDDMIYLEVRDPADASKELLYNITATTTPETAR